MPKDNFETPAFLRTDDEDSTQPSKMQEWLDVYLRSLTMADLKVMAGKARKMTEQDKARRDELFDTMEQLHTKHILDLPKRLRFNAPGRGMVGARAKAMLEKWNSGAIKEPIPLATPEKPNSVL